MAYYLPDLSAPQDWDEFWEKAEYALQFLDSDFYTLVFETQEEAIAGKYGKSLDPDDLRFESAHVFRFRETDDRDNLHYFYELGRETLELVRTAIEERIWTPAFAHQWGVLMFCHGFVMPSAFARGDDQQSKRAGAAGGRSQSKEIYKQWFAHYFLRERNAGRSRMSAEAAVERLVQSIVNGDGPNPGTFDRLWFSGMLDEESGGLTGGFRQKKLTEKEILRLAALPTGDLPPLDMKIPYP